MKALVHSGGGSKGAWGAGVIKYLLGDLQKTYDIFCGVSVGAINAAFLAQYKSGEEKEAANTLYNLWLQLDSSKIYKRWFPFGRGHALWKQSFFDSSPLHHLVKSVIDVNRIKESGKLVSVGTVSLSSGKYTIFNHDTDNFIDAIIASASFPVMFSPVSFMGQLWSDGGTKEMSPIKRAIDLGADEIDIIITSPNTRVKKFLEKPTIIDILKRSLDLSTDKILANDIEKVEIYNQLAKSGLTDKKSVKLNIFRPEFNLTEDLLDFNPLKLKEMAELGYKHAKTKSFL
jgi:NTE family protein